MILEECKATKVNSKHNGLCVLSLLLSNSLPPVSTNIVADLMWQLAY